MSPGASVIIVTYNSENYIGVCLRSVIATLRPQDEVLIIDNHSSDGTLAMIRKIIPAGEARARVLPQSQNLGFSRGCNIGIENSDKEYVVLLNPDAEVFGPWIARLTEHFEIYPNTGAVGPLSNNVLATQNITFYISNYHDFLNRASDLLDYLHRLFKYRSLPAKLLIGFCIALRRDLLNRFGALDENLFLGGDDLDLSWRLREKGYQLRVALNVFVNHFGHKSFKALPAEQEKNCTQQAHDALFEKMRAYYAPNKIPNPIDYFGINWWKPSILADAPQSDFFTEVMTRSDYENLFQSVKDELQRNRHAEAIVRLRAALPALIRDYKTWYTLGSIFSIINDYDNAELALANAAALEFQGARAKAKLLDLLTQGGRSGKLLEFLQTALTERAV